MKRDTFLKRLLRGCWRARCRDDWRDVVGEDWTDEIMDVEVTDRFHAKQGRSTGRWILRKGKTTLAVYLKRHYRLPWWQGFLSLFCPNRNNSPAMQEASHLEWARAQGLKVPEVVAVAERSGPFTGLQSVLAVEELQEMLPLHEAIPLAAETLDSRTFYLWKRSLIEEVARIARVLHQKKHFHKDLYLCHFYIHRHCTTHLPTWRDRVYLIDLHRLARHRVLSSIWQSKDLAQLMYSSDLEAITNRDRLYFWKCYFKDEKESRWLRKLVLYRWRRYHRHNEKRKRRELEQQQKAA